MLPDIKMSDFTYDLPEDRIAKYPLAIRDASKLLVWQQGRIDHRIFKDVPALFTGEELLVFNNTKVIPARLFFRKETGALIEIFMLAPILPSVVDLAMQQTKTGDWQCTIGNLKAWKKDLVLTREITVNEQPVQLHAELLDGAQMHVRLHWSGGFNLVQILEAAGQTPIPPYLRRAAEEKDRNTYQTVYSKKEGAVAAPTAGLHFTPDIIDQITQKGVRADEVTLHVSAGTFQPVKVENAMEHNMHYEQIVVKRSSILALLQGKKVVAVGTTSMRTLESLYWMGTLLMGNPDADLILEKTYPYFSPVRPTVKMAMEALLARIDRDQTDELHGVTQLMIVPGYTFRICEALITNFHQPGSTLLLLVAAFIGEKNWKTLYQTALENDYRFLSYGDSSFLELGY